MYKRQVLILISLVVLILTACGVDVSVDSEGVTITINLTEPDFDVPLQNASLSGDDGLLIEISDVDFQDDLIRISGTYENEDGDTVEGSLDMTFGAEDGALNAEIVAVAFEGLDLEDKRIVRVNEELSHAFAHAASEAENVEFTSVTITDDSLQMVIRANTSE